MNPQAASPGPLLVACLCAAWCRTCDDYRPTFDALAQEFGTQTCFAWVDIEDQEQLLGAVDVTDFPTLLIARGESIGFFGPITPHPQTLRQLVQRGLQDSLGSIGDPTVAGLPARLRQLPHISPWP